MTHIQKMISWSNLYRSFTPLHMETCTRKKYTPTRGRNNTTKFVNYCEYRTLERDSLSKRIGSVHSILNRLNNPSSRAAADQDELTAYKLRARFLIKALIPGEARTEAMNLFLISTNDLVPQVDAMTTIVGSVIAGYTHAIASFEEHSKDFEQHFDTSEKLFGDYRHEKWLASR